MNAYSKGNHRNIKFRNKQLILQQIQLVSSTNRSTIARQLQLSKPTVSAIVEELIAEGWVLEDKMQANTNKVGRKPIQLRFNHHARYVMGADIGGTNVSVALSDLSGNILKKRVFKTQRYLLGGLVLRINEVINDMLSKADISKEKLLGMGIGIPGIVNVDQGIVVDAPTLKWHHYHLQKEAEETFKIPVVIDNDVNIGVLGEQWIGNAVDKSNVLLISIGTGVGCGILLQKKLFRGAAWGAGEIGYMITDKNEAQKNIVSHIEGYGFLDNQIGGPALERKMQAELEKKADSHPLKQKDDWEAKDIFDLAMASDQLANKVVDEFIEQLGFSIINIASILNPEVVLLGGGIAKSGYWFLNRINALVKQYAPFSTKVALAGLGDDLGVTGAVRLFLKEHESVINGD